MSSVNRYLKNKAMDRIDHALGRPVNPLDHEITYRDHFATDCPDQIAEFRGSPHWQEGHTQWGMSFFHVTDDGRQALSDHLKDIEDPHRLYCVTWRPGRSESYTRDIAAKSRGAARYAYYIIVSDVNHDLTFGDFCRQSTARLA